MFWFLLTFYSMDAAADTDPPSIGTWHNPPMTGAEWLRKLAHMAAFWPALLLPYLTPGQALGISFSLVLMNMIILPRFAPSLYRTREKGRGALEIVLYPCAVMATIAAFGWLPSQAGEMFGTSLPGKPAWYLPVSIAWFGLACVDACIGLACRIFPNGPTFPWNRRKPILAVGLGTIAACFPAWLLVQFTLPSALNSWGWAWFLGLLVFCAIAETVWFGIADNIVVPFSLSVVIPFLPSTPLFLSSIPVTWAENSGFWNGPVFAILVSVGFGIAAYSANLLTIGGSILGGILALILMHGNPWLFAFLSGFFLLGNLATRIGLARKQALGIAEPRSGKRGAAEVFGAMGVATWMTPLVHLGHSEPSHTLHHALLVCIAPLIAKTMDTVSSEIGKAMAGRTWSVNSFRQVAPGTDGAVSIAGTFWGLLAAKVLALTILVLGWGNGKDVAVLLGIAILANLFEAYWKGWAGPKGMDQGAHTNVLMTLVAAILAWIWWFGLGG